MRGFAGTIGMLMIMSGLAALVTGLVWTSSVHSGVHGQAYQIGWTCGPDDSGRPDRQKCLITGESQAQQAADSAAGTAWLLGGVGLIIGGGVLCGAVLVSAGRPVMGPQRNYSQQPHQVPQQQYGPQQPVPSAGSFAPQPNYGQQQA